MIMKREGIRIIETFPIPSFKSLCDMNQTIIHITSNPIVVGSIKELKADRFELPPTLCTKYAATSLPHENVKLEAIYDRSQLNITI